MTEKINKRKPVVEAATTPVVSPETSSILGSLKTTPDEEYRESDEINKLAIPLFGRTFISLGVLLTLAIGLVSATYAITRYIEIQPLNEKLEANEKRLANVEAEKQTLQSKYNSLQRLSNEAIANAKRPVLLHPSNGSSLIGTHLMLNWDYGGHTDDLNYILELRNLSSPSEKTIKRAVVRPETKRFHVEVKGLAAAEYLWRIRPGVIVGADEVAQGPWSSYGAFSVYDTVANRIKSTCRLRVGSTPTSYDAFVRSEGEGKYDGFEMELVTWVANNLQHELACKEQVKVEIVEIPWEQLLDAVQNGDVDIAIRSISRSKEREKRYSNLKFSLPYLANDQLLVSLKQDTKFPASLKDAIVGVKAGSINDQAARFLAPRHGFTVDSSYTAYGDIFQSLNEGRIAFALVDSVLANRVLGKHYFACCDSNELKLPVAGDNTDTLVLDEKPKARKAREWKICQASFHRT